MKRAWGVISKRDRELLERSCGIQGLRITRDGECLVLDGQVPCYSMKKLASQAAARLTGTQRIVNRLRLTPHRHGTEAELLQSARAALRSRRSLASLVANARTGRRYEPAQPLSRLDEGPKRRGLDAAA